ncbi:MAG: T9SS type B sorting domain-containing protein [Flavobacteriales bacterium]|nr:MAG: T9SS type B sorting domain-containing protein [Flavobacteriales bacterium]
MKVFLLLTFLLLGPWCGLMLHGQNVYYVKPDGSNSTNGLSDESAWNPEKLNATYISPGSTVLFKRNSTFNFTLKIEQSNITYGGYGTGTDPVISGFITLKSWSKLSGHVYYVSLEVPTLNMVTIDGNIKPMGRYPKSGYLAYTSHSNNNAISGTSVSTIPFDPSGGEVVIRKDRYILDRHPITSKSGNTINYGIDKYFYGNSNAYSPQDGNGYFIQKHLGTLTADGDWFYDAAAKKLYVYFENNAPDARVVKASALNTNVLLNTMKGVVFNNITFEGANEYGAYHVGTSDITYNNCNWRNQGGDGVYGISISNLTINGGSIDGSFNAGIQVEHQGQNTVINNVTVKNSGMVAGAGRSGDGAQIGIFVYGQATKITNCSVINSGYNAIDFSGGEQSLIENNFIDTYCAVKDDGGGIYTYTATNSIIKNNIILNAVGAYAGAEWGYWEPHGKAAGIYLDQGIDNHHITVSNNTIAHGDWAGIFVNNNGHNKITNNISYDLFYSLLISDFSGPRNNEIVDNQFIAKKTTQYPFHIEMGFADNLSQLGSFDRNVFARPIDDDKTFSVYRNYKEGGGRQYMSLESWKAATKLELNSTKSPRAITNENSLFFEYNSSNIDKSVTLSGSFTDFKKNLYSGRLVLKPFTSVVFIQIPGGMGRVSITSTSNMICSTLPPEFNALSENGGERAKYQWKINGIAAQISTSNKFSPVNLKANDIISCDLINPDISETPIATSNSITMIAGAAPPVVNIGSNQLNVCEGSMISFVATVQNRPINIKFIWKKNGAVVADNVNGDTYSTSSISNADQITCTIIGEASTCLPAFEIVSNSLVVSTTKIKIPGISISKDLSAMTPNSLITFTASVTDSGNSPAYQWKVNKIHVGGNSKSFSTSSLKDKDVVSCDLTATGECITNETVSSNEIEITFVKGLISPPTAFSPNGDGVNDVWNINDLTYYENCVVKVFAINGAQVFQSKGYQVPWDGRYNNNLCNAGVYYYAIDLGDKKKITGPLLIMR